MELPDEGPHWLGRDMDTWDLTALIEELHLSRLHRVAEMAPEDWFIAGLFPGGEQMFGNPLFWVT